MHCATKNGSGTKCNEILYSHGGVEEEATISSYSREKAPLILGNDVMELLKTSKSKKYAIVMQDFLIKWPLVFTFPD